MLYYNSISIAEYYKKGKIDSLFKHNEKGIYYKGELIPYNEMKVFTNAKGKVVLTSKFIPEPIVLGNLDL